MIIPNQKVLYTNTNIACKWKVLSLGLSLFFVFTLNAQTLRFKEPLRESVHSQSILQEGTFYYSVGQIYSSGVGRYGVILMKLDSLGQLLKTRTLLDSNFTYFPSNLISLEKHLNGDFISIVNKGTNPQSNGILVFNKNLDTLNYFLPIQDSKVRNFHQVKQTLDSGFVITGIQFENNMYHASLIRTDKNGQLLWEQVYKEPDTFSIEPFHVYPTPDGGFLMAGQKVYLADYQTADPVLLRTDSAGNLLWKKTYGGNQVDGIACAAYRDDGNIMLFYSQGTKPLQQGHSLAAVFSIIDDSNGDELSKKLYPFINYRSLLSYNLLKDGNKFIATGEFGQEGVTLAGGAIQGYTMAVDKDLDDLWFKNYSGQDVNARSDDWSVLYDLRPTADGGYISGGYFKTFDTTHVNVHLGFNGWIVKMDSMGCVVQNCVNRIGTEELEVEISGVNVFPNPSSGHFTVIMNTKLNGQIRLYDLKGMLIQEAELIKGIGIVNPKQGVPNGMYIIKVINTDGGTASKKIIIQE